MRPAKNQISLRIRAVLSVSTEHSVGSQGYSVFMWTAKTDQPAQMRNLIRVFAGRTYNRVGNAVPRLKLFFTYNQPSSHHENMPI